MDQVPNRPRSWLARGANYLPIPPLCWLTFFLKVRFFSHLYFSERSSNDDDDDDDERKGTGRWGCIEKVQNIILSERNERDL